MNFATFYNRYNLFRLQLIRTRSKIQEKFRNLIIKMYFEILFCYSSSQYLSTKKDFRIYVLIY